MTALLETCGSLADCCANLHINEPVAPDSPGHGVLNFSSSRLNQLGLAPRAIHSSPGRSRALPLHAPLRDGGSETVRAKPDLVPDCDVHGQPMYRDECPAGALGLPGTRDVIVWRCAHPGCARYFEGAVGYRRCAHPDGSPTPRCARDRAFLVVQRAQRQYICPVAGCPNRQQWKGSSTVEAEPRNAELVFGRIE